MAEEVADEALVFGDFFGSLAVADACGLDDRLVGGLPCGDEAGHDVDEGDKAVVEDLELPAGVAVEGVDEGGLGLDALRPAGVDADWPGWADIGGGGGGRVGLGRHARCYQWCVGLVAKEELGCHRWAVV